MGHVYFARVGILVKIGYTAQNPKDRVGKRKLIALFEGNREDEADAHRVFEEYRVRKGKKGPQELFSIPQDIVEKIAKYALQHGAKGLVQHADHVVVLLKVREFLVQNDAPVELIEELNRCISEI